MKETVGKLETLRYKMREMAQIERSNLIDAMIEVIPAEE